jgi:hypothetical protein
MVNRLSQVRLVQYRGTQSGRSLSHHGEVAVGRGRPVAFSICEWGDNKPWLWTQPLGHLWRTTGDITNCWDCVIGHGSWNSYGILQILDKQEGLRKYAGPGQWNDPDMMEVGNLASTSEDRGAGLGTYFIEAAGALTEVRSDNEGRASPS